eukprot:1837601-Pleurochrysis_carterae.AAC.1
MARRDTLSSLRLEHRIRSRQRMPGGSPCGPLWYTLHHIWLKKKRCKLRKLPSRNGEADLPMSRARVYYSSNGAGCNY